MTTDVRQLAHVLTEPTTNPRRVPEAARSERKRAEGDITFEFVADSLLEGRGFQLQVPPLG